MSWSSTQPCHEATLLRFYSVNALLSFTAPGTSTPAATIYLEQKGTDFDRSRVTGGEPGTHGIDVIAPPRRATRFIHPNRFLTNRGPIMLTRPLYSVSATLLIVLYRTVTQSDLIQLLP